MEDLTKSGHVGVRWQAQAEEHLTQVRALTSEAMMIATNRPHDEITPAVVRAQLATAHATAAAALLQANGLSDLEQALDRLQERFSDLLVEVEQVGDVKSTHVHTGKCGDQHKVEGTH